MSNKLVARKIAFAIIKNLDGRSGMMNGVDDDTRDEILEDFTNTIYKILEEEE